MFPLFNLRLFRIVFFSAQIPRARIRAVLIFETFIMFSGFLLTLRDSSLALLPRPYSSRTGKLVGKQFFNLAFFDPRSSLPRRFFLSRCPGSQAPSGSSNLLTFTHSWLSVFEARDFSGYTPADFVQLKDLSN